MGQLALLALGVGAISAGVWLGLNRKGLDQRRSELVPNAYVSAAFRAIVLMIVGVLALASLLFLRQ